MKGILVICLTFLWHEKQYLVSMYLHVHYSAESVGCGVTWNEEPVDSISVEADNTANGSVIKELVKSDYLQVDVKSSWFHSLLPGSQASE